MPYLNPDPEKLPALFAGLADSRLVATVEARGF